MRGTPRAGCLARARMRAAHLIAPGATPRTVLPVDLRFYLRRAARAGMPGAFARFYPRVTAPRRGITAAPHRLPPASGLPRAILRFVRAYLQLHAIIARPDGWMVRMDQDRLFSGERAAYFAAFACLRLPLLPPYRHMPSLPHAADHTCHYYLLLRSCRFAGYGWRTRC